MAEPILIIDPGHGGEQHGGGSNEYFKEKDMNLKISLYQYRRFKELKLPVAITRTEDITLTSTQRTAIVKNSGAKFCISNHVNAAPSSAARGVSVIYSIYSDGKLAKKILQALVEAGLGERRAYTRESEANPGKDYYFMHRETGKVETEIIEYGFATNEQDTKLLLANWEKFAEAVVKAFCEFIGHNYTPPRDQNGNLPVIKKGIAIEIDGNKLSGYVTEAGVSMIQLRELANLLGWNIKWDGSRNTVLITTKK